MSIKLKPCPFCGEKKVMIKKYKSYLDDSPWIIVCRCSMINHDRGYKTKKDAIENWNSRAFEKGGLVDELVEYARHKGWCNIAQCVPVEYTGREVTKRHCDCGWNKLKEALLKAKQAKSGA